MAETTQAAALSQAFAGFAAAAAPSLVSVHAGRSIASGFVWKDGLVVTADEALPEDAEPAVTLAGGATVAARIAGRDPTTDIALLRLDRADVPSVSLTAVPPPVGALALAVGAQDGAPTAALGVVARSAGPWRSLRGGDIDARIELDLRLRRSAEGGLVLDAAGQAIGMAVFGPRRRVLVIPAATIERVATALAAHGRVARGYLGLGMQPVALDGGERAGIMVMSVDPRGPGAAADLHQGDIIIACDGEPVGNIRALLRRLGPDSIGRRVTLEVSRGGRTQPIAVTVAERAAG